MHRIAGSHDVALAIVGGRPDAEGATAADIDAEALNTGFADAYIGERDFAAHRMRELGWCTSLEQAGIPQHHLNDAAVTRDWLTSQFRGIGCSSRHRIEVFHHATA